MNSRAFLSVHSYVLSAVALRSRRSGAYLVLVIRVQVQAALLRGLPDVRYARVFVRLVNDLGDQLRAFVNCARVWSRQFAAEDGILATGGDKET